MRVRIPLHAGERPLASARQSKSERQATSNQASKQPAAATSGQRQPEVALETSPCERPKGPRKSESFERRKLLSKEERARQSIRQPERHEDSPLIQPHELHRGSITSEYGGRRRWDDYALRSRTGAMCLKDWDEGIRVDEGKRNSRCKNAHDGAFSKVPRFQTLVVGRKPAPQLCKHTKPR